MKDGCLKYWDLCSTITIDAAVALWCDVEPGELRALGFSTSCMDAKREAIIDALRGGRLEYEDRPVPRSDGRGLWHGAGLDELIEKNGARIKKDSLRRWFLDMKIEDRPAFLFDEMRQADMLPDGGEIAEMNTMRALAVMAWIMSEKNPTHYSVNNRPNATEIGKAIESLAEEVFGLESAPFIYAARSRQAASMNFSGSVRVSSQVPDTQSDKFLPRSTRVNSRLPGGTEHQNISRRVDIAVVPCATFGTGPFPNR
jgi:hypothetical protein